MKSIKLLMAMVMLAIGSTAAMAQASYTDKDGNEYQFKRHWFLDIQAGGQYTVGEASFSDLLSPNFQGAIGYQFSPVFGLRGQINGIWSKGGWNGYKATKDGTPYTASYKWKYVAPGVDFMVNLSNLFCGWNPNRVFSKEQLAYEVFGPDAKGSDALVEESVSLLKSKLDGLSSKWSIRLIWGVGYKFEVNE